MQTMSSSLKDLDCTHSYLGSGQQLGDIIVAIDGNEINTEVDMFKVLESRKPGDVITVTTER